MSSQLSLRLPSQLLDEIDRRAKRSRRPRAAVIREALAAYVALPEGALDGRPADRVRDLIGAVDDLPRDLATHANKYLAGLGRHRR